jgi:hypothetical protein
LIEEAAAASLLGMADFRHIAIFILGTVVRNGRLEQPFPTYLESRILPLLQTWGQFFPHLYFVFGRNVHDVDFLTKRCRLTTSNALSRPLFGWEHDNRQLKVRSPQVKLEHSLDLYRCPVNAHDLFYFRSADERLNLTTSSSEEITGTVLEFNVLLARNCTGEYFGYGPTCRCQEAMRCNTIHVSSYALPIQHPFRVRTLTSRHCWFLLLQQILP